MNEIDTKTGGEERYKYIREVVYAHAKEILKERDDVHGKICDEIQLYFFNINQPPTEDLSISNREDIYRIFEDPERRWTGSTYIKPTLEYVINRWFKYRQDKQGAFIVIYTDDILNDENALIGLIRETCLKINSATDIKILIIGIGSEFEEINKTDFFVGLGINAFQFKYNIVDFYLIDEMVGGIILHLSQTMRFLRSASLSQSI